MAIRIPETEIFLLERDREWSIAYAPLSGEICLIDNDSAAKLLSTPSESRDEELSGFLSGFNTIVPANVEMGSPAVEKTTKLSLIPNNICNLACTYCYSAAGRNDSRISLENLEAGISWFVDAGRIQEKSISIFVTGGGEPLATWDTTSHAVSYARRLAKEQKLDLYVSIITNGTLVTDDKIDFFKRNDCAVGVSFDVLEDVQNTNRGRFGTVNRNILSMLDAGLKVMINSTIIPSTVHLMPQMTETVIRRYPRVSQFTMEPVTGVELFDSADKMRVFYDIFFEKYFESKRMAREAGLNLRFTFDDALRGIVTRHCPGKFALTPSGRISACHLVSSPLEPRFDDCTYGVVKNGHVCLDSEKFGEIYSRNLFSYPECIDCIAKWSCGGECFTRRSTYSEEYMAEVCRFNRRVVEHLIKEEVDDVQDF